MRKNNGYCPLNSKALSGRFATVWGLLFFIRGNIAFDLISIISFFVPT